MAGRESFDAVVVGAGAAGCVVAARLAESGTRSVLLLEAGQDLRAAPTVEMRDGWGYPKDHHWGLQSEPNRDGEVQPLRRCKLVGGTSWVTRFVVRGSPGDFNEWADLGNPGWGFDDCLPYFKRIESDIDFGHEPWHGDSGPIPVNRYRDVETTELQQAAIDAMERWGFPRIEDHNQPGVVGLGRMPMSSRDGSRVSVADAYLPTGATPSNLTIRSETQVARILFDGARAHGVELVDGSVVEGGQIVLSAGVFGSPAVLMRSGVGPADDLRSVGLAAQVNLSGVGANLSDHPALDMEYETDGPAREAPVVHTTATFHSEATPTGEAPDLMLWVADPFLSPGEPTLFSIEVILLKPKARGRVQLRSPDPMDQPKVHLPYLSDTSDVDRLLEGYSIALEVANRPELSGLLKPQTTLTEDDDARRMIRESNYPVPHFVGTCAMGPDPDQGAVVDASGRVHGIEGLSVIDASIMPTVPSGFTHISTIMVAERLAEIVGAVS
jgi:choline dehydrogenase